MAKEDGYRTEYIAAVVFGFRVVCKAWKSSIFGGAAYAADDEQVFCGT